MSDGGETGDGLGSGVGRWRAVGANTQTTLQSPASPTPSASRPVRTTTRNLASAPSRRRPRRSSTPPLARSAPSSAAVAGAASSRRSRRSCSTSGAGTTSAPRSSGRVCTTRSCPQSQRSRLGPTASMPSGSRRSRRAGTRSGSLTSTSGRARCRLLSLTSAAYGPRAIAARMALRPVTRGSQTWDCNVVVPFLSWSCPFLPHNRNTYLACILYNTVYAILATSKRLTTTFRSLSPLRLKYSLQCSPLPQTQSSFCLPLS